MNTVKYIYQLYVLRQSPMQVLDKGNSLLILMQRDDYQARNIAVFIFHSSFDRRTRYVATLSIDRMGPVLP